ncbi:transmembrane protein 14A isoform X1 [Manis pentadactyla]|uniref:transmembrane protein 14A isoform X1 n=1 Tax=Manis pentadactyla TaxID=143292 RepID=UPI00255CC371|nr:transmembrane protein 14A isoform X1 [Manis pentadactyla]XP_057349739.1 transmembrane protein 14A isoform X1 [Manis pentadactyla]
MDLIGFGYAALLTFGSILGYKRRGGVPSLIAGLFIGFLAFYGACRVSIDKRDVKLSLFTAFFLATIMGVRYKRSKKIMPAGLVAGLRCFSTTTACHTLFPIFPSVRVRKLSFGMQTEQKKHHIQKDPSLECPGFVEFISGSVRVEKTLIDWQRVVRRALRDTKERSIKSVDGDQAILEAYPSCPAECCVCCPTSHSGAFRSILCT